jgi:ATP-dependent RNA helicase SUPV3L1/SUV3
MADASGVVAGVTPAEHAVVQRLMNSKQNTLPTTGFQIAAGSAYLGTMSGLTGETRLEALLSHFLRHADCGDGFFKAFVPDEQLERAAELDAYQGMLLADKLTFSMAPMTSQNETLNKAWHEWAKAHGKGHKISLDFLSSAPRMADLAEAEDSVRLLSAYRWFAYRMPAVFIDLERADHLLPIWTAVVDGHLKSKFQQGGGGGRNGQPSWYWGTN